MRRSSVLSATPLDETAVMRLVERGLRKEDEKECWIADNSPLAALTGALDGFGPSYAVWGLVDGYPSVVGAFGLNVTQPQYPTIWSLWTDDLTHGMKRQILRDTNTWVVKLLWEAGVGAAANYVLDSNKLAIQWLKASRCFNLSETTDKIGKGKHTMRYFQTKTPRELTAAKERRCRTCGAQVDERFDCCSNPAFIRQGPRNV